MNKRYLAMVAVGGCAAWAAVGHSNGGRSGVEFTKAALPPPATIDMRVAASPSYLSLPIALGPLTQRAEDALPENLATVRDILTDAACGKRTTSVDCANARLEGSITRGGPMELAVASDLVTLAIPVRYTLSATGIGWASHLTEQKAGEAKVDLAFAIVTNAGGGLDVTRRDAPPTEDATVSLLKANLKLARLLEPHLKLVAKAAEEDLRRALAQLPVKTAVAHAWDALARPLELGTGSGLWLKGTPDYYGVGRLVSTAGALTYQVPISAHLQIVEAEHGQANAAKRVASLSQDGVPTGPSRIRVAVPIDLETLRQQAENALGHDQLFESRADRFSEPVQVRVHHTRVYPALHQIGLALDVEVTTAKRDIYSGTVHLAGRPVLDAATGTVTLADIGFPPVATNDAADRLPGLPRIGSEPFASLLTAAAKIDVSRALAEVLPRARQMLNQQIGSDLLLEAKLNAATPVALELARDGAWLTVDLTGDLALVYNGAATAPLAPAIESASAGASKGVNLVPMQKATFIPDARVPVTAKPEPVPEYKAAKPSSAAKATDERKRSRVADKGSASRPAHKRLPSIEQTHTAARPRPQRNASVPGIAL